MARKFLYVVAALVFVVIAALLIYRIWGVQLMRLALVPSAPFIEQQPEPAGTYTRADMWFARPDLPGNPALWRPDGYRDPAPQGQAAVFFIHPTSFLERSAWNAPLNDATANDRARLFIRGQASAFNGVGQIWAPRYRQAAFGAFLTTKPEAARALNAAYRDVAMAWDAFLAAAPPDAPIIVAGHSQGALHLERLLRERIADRPVARRIVAAYVVGWPISVETDLPALGLPACARADQAGCILSWQSFAEPADPSLITETFEATTGFNGRSRRGTHILCVNPLTGTQDGAADAKANSGGLKPSLDLKTAEFAPGLVPARCDARGFLLIGAPPEGISAYVLPGNNYHVFDYSLFWANIRADAARRLAAFERR